jgi:hypothetical protein
MFTKAHVLSEIARTAKANGGVPLGRLRFYAETGIKETDWLGKYWARWGDAVREAGLTPNTLQVGYGEEHLLERLASLAREIGRFPERTEIQLKARRDEKFPNARTFQRLGSKKALAEKLTTFCKSRSGYDDVLSLCIPVVGTVLADADADSSSGAEETLGYVYLLKSGRYYKIGRTNAAGRRERELAIQLPERASNVHSIKTDDPVGIEDYWHRRFSDRRKNGEWFELTAKDVAAFKRRKLM